MAPNSHADWLRFNIQAITDMLSQDMSALNRMSFEKLKADLEADLAQELEDEKISPEEKAWLDKAAKDIADLKSTWSRALFSCNESKSLKPVFENTETPVSRNVVGTPTSNSTSSWTRVRSLYHLFQITRLT